MWQFGTSAINTVVHWHKLGDVENECTSYNFRLFAIFVPKKLSDFVEVWRSYNKNNFAVFLRHGVEFRGRWLGWLANTNLGAELPTARRLQNPLVNGFAESILIFGHLKKWAKLPINTSHKHPAVTVCHNSRTEDWPKFASNSKTYRYDTTEEFNVDSKPECDQLNPAHETKTNKRQCSWPANSTLPCGVCSTRVS